jgi:hypothetical protein
MNKNAQKPMRSNTVAKIQFKPEDSPYHVICKDSHDQPTQDYIVSCYHILEVLSLSATSHSPKESFIEFSQYFKGHSYSDKDFFTFGSKLVMDEILKSKLVFTLKRQDAREKFLKQLKLWYPEIKITEEVLMEEPDPELYTCKLKISFEYNGKKKTKEFLYIDMHSFLDNIAPLLGELTSEKLYNISAEFDFETINVIKLEAAKAKKLSHLNILTFVSLVPNDNRTPSLDFTKPYFVPSTQDKVSSIVPTQAYNEYNLNKTKTTPHLKKAYELIELLGVGNLITYEELQDQFGPTPNYDETFLVKCEQTLLKFLAKKFVLLSLRTTSSPEDVFLSLKVWYPDINITVLSSKHSEDKHGLHEEDMSLKIEYKEQKENVSFTYFDIRSFFEKVLPVIGKLTGDNYFLILDNFSVGNLYIAHAPKENTKKLLENYILNLSEISSSYTF